MNHKNFGHMHADKKIIGEDVLRQDRLLVR